MGGDEYLAGCGRDEVCGLEEGGVCVCGRYTRNSLCWLMLSSDNT